MTKFNVNENGQMDRYFTTAELAKRCVHATSVMYFYRIGITRKDIHDCPIFEIAGFRDKNIAMNYVKNIVQKHKDWDERTMQVVVTAVALPPMTVSDDTLAVKMEMLSKLNRE